MSGCVSHGSGATSVAPSNLPTTATTWPASLTLALDAFQGRTVLRRVRHRGPLRVQRPFYPEGPGVCHVYLLHPPGGLAGGDELTVDIQLAGAAAAVITTPAANKFYRSNRRLATQSVRCHVAAGACLEYLPQESIFFDSCLARQTLRVDLEPGARFLGWEISVLGRRASGEQFAAGSALSQIGLWCQQGHQQRPLWLDRSHYVGGNPLLGATWGLRGQPVYATLIAYGGRIGDAVDPLRQQIAAWPAGEEAGVTYVDGVVVARYLGQHAQLALHRCESLRAILRPYWADRPTLAPRIWAT